MAAAAVLGGLEGALRLSGWPDPGLYDGDTASLWTLRAGLSQRVVPFRERGTSFRVRTNSYGYRGGEPAPGAILCLGDSTTFGWGVEEDEAWPAVLARETGRRTLNGGVPGYSTVQGLATIDHALTMKPWLVIVAYLVRDAELAPTSDADRPPPTPRPKLALLSAIRTLRGAPSSPPGVIPRVPPAAYLENIRELVKRVRASGANARILAFPMQTPPAEHLAALESLRGDVPILSPSLPDEAFFAEDPIHLTPGGNASLASILAGALTGGP